MKGLKNRRVFDPSKVRGDAHGWDRLSIFMLHANLAFILAVCCWKVYRFGFEPVSVKDFIDSIFK
jgi:hypothetical protein